MIAYKNGLYIRAYAKIAANFNIRSIKEHFAPDLPHDLRLILYIFFLIYILLNIAVIKIQCITMILWKLKKIL